MSETTTEKNTKKSEFDFLILKLVLKKNWYWSIVFLGLTLGLAFIYLRYTKPVYESSIIIQLDNKEDGKEVLDIDLKANPDNNLSENVELLKSTFLIRKALEKLPLEVSYYVEGQILEEEKYLSSGYTVRILHVADSTKYKGKYTITDVSEDDITLNYNGKTKTYELNDPITTDYATFSVTIDDIASIQSQLEENKIHFRVNDLDALAKRYSRSVVVQVINPDAKTVKIAFRSFNPNLSKDVVEAINQTFNEFDLDRKSKSSQSILNFINNQIDTVFSSLKASENKIQDYKKEKKLKDPKIISSTLQEKLNMYQNELVSLQIENKLLGEVNEQIKKEITIDDLFNLMPALAGSKYEDVLRPEFEELKTTILKKKSLLTKVTSNNIQIKEVNDAIDVQKKMILSTVETIKEKNSERDSLLQYRADSLDAEFFALPEKEMELARLQRVFELNEKYYNLLLEKRTQYSIAKAGFTPSNRVLEPATSNSVPVSPNKKLILLAAVFMGLFLGLLTVVISYLRFDKIPDEKTLKRWLPDYIGFLGSIPKVREASGPSKLLVHQRPKSRLTESLRSIRTNLEFIESESSTKIIGVTSTTSGEGKTFVCANLGGVLALTGKKVLLMDFDLRKPKMHLAFGDDSATDGISAILSGRKDWKDCVKSTQIESLFYIPAGITPPNPSELINGKVTQPLIQELKAEYDIIIIDNPPVGLVSDGIKILNSVDYPIYIFRTNYSKKDYIDELRSIHDFKKIKSVYVILNSENISTHKYGYGYGYYDQENEKKGLFKRK